nr:MAG TPA: hypothetical protein [Caudoviricetes sp.]
MIVLTPSWQILPDRNTVLSCISSLTTNVYKLNCSPS